jgi:tyrosyl-tRNA synthetase
MPLLRGTDGDQKMSKSYDNYVGITEPATEQFGKTMSIPDALLAEWIRMAVPVEAAELDAALAEAGADPYRAKRALARRIVTLYHGATEAEQAEAHFDRLFREHAAPDHVPELKLPVTDERLRVAERGAAWLPGLLVAARVASSNGEAGRLIEQGAISIDGARATDRNASIPVEAGGTCLVQRGKRQFVRVHFT